MLTVTYVGHYQHRDYRLPDGKVVRFERKQTRTDLDPKHKKFLKDQADLTVEDDTELSRDMLL